MIEEEKNTNQSIRNQFELSIMRRMLLTLGISNKFFGTTSSCIRYRMWIIWIQCASRRWNFTCCDFSHRNEAGVEARGRFLDLWRFLWENVCGFIICFVLWHKRLQPKVFLEKRIENWMKFFKRFLSFFFSSHFQRFNKYFNVHILSEPSWGYHFSRPLCSLQWINEFF